MERGQDLFFKKVFTQWFGGNSLRNRLIRSFGIWLALSLVAYYFYSGDFSYHLPYFYLGSMGLGFVLAYRDIQKYEKEIRRDNLNKPILDFFEGKEKKGALYTIGGGIMQEFWKFAFRSRHDYPLLTCLIIATLLPALAYSKLVVLIWLNQYEEREGTVLVNIIKLPESKPKSLINQLGELFHFLPTN
jgi:hypothetical protein